MPHFLWKAWRGITLAAITIIFPLGLILLGIKVWHHHHNFYQSIDSYKVINNDIKDFFTGPRNEIDIQAREDFESLNPNRQANELHYGYKTNIETLTHVYCDLVREIGAKQINLKLRGYISDEFFFKDQETFYILRFAKNYLIGSSRIRGASLTIHKIPEDLDIPSNIKDANKTGYIPYEFNNQNQELGSVKKAYGFQYVRDHYKVLDTDILIEATHKSGYISGWCIVIKSQSSYKKIKLEVSEEIVANLDSITNPIYKKFTINKSQITEGGTGDYH